MSLGPKSPSALARVVLLKDDAAAPKVRPTVAPGVLFAQDSCGVFGKKTVRGM
jgi:hypothetical protein